ncbi:hypothetical protein PQX77_017973 [Marasmius sp. AFHP31]|nr:hypothetical protein PQX77_017973 [Marasmius sp. AFHP31]
MHRGFSRSIWSWLKRRGKPKKNTQPDERQPSVNVTDQLQVDIEQCHVVQPPGSTHDSGLGTQASMKNTQQEAALDDNDHRQVDVEQCQGMQPPQGTALGTQVSTPNTNIGLGSQNNNNNSGTQNVQYGEGQINQVLGGEVNLYINKKGFKGLNRLSKAIAGVGASHKAEHQFSRGKCLPETRETARAAIHDWASAKGPGALPICWLSGAAGVGKTAIALTIAELLDNLGLLTSSFFFFRSDAKRNNPSALALTIAHELAITAPLMRKYIEARILADPRILEASLERQFCELVTTPASVWRVERSRSEALAAANIIILDGLDECGDEETQLRILSIIESTYQNIPDFPLRFLICSRPEAWIQEAFSDNTLLCLSKFIVLDDNPEARKDIKRYLLHHFREIVTSWKYRHVQFPSPWPSEEDLEILVEISCAQFVYAITVIKFIKLAYGHPITQLQIILNSATERRLSNSPYHDLDCLYQVILSANPVQDELILILVAILTLPVHRAEATPAVIEGILGLPSGQMDLALRGMYPVLKIGGRKDEIKLYHTSFQDYLLDHMRSGIDIAAQKHIIACRWLQSLSIDRLQSLSNGRFYDESCFDARGWIALCMSIPQPTLGLLKDLQNVDLGTIFSWYLDSPHGSWMNVFHVLVPWVKKYPCRGTSEVELVETLVHRLQGPRGFHLVWSPGVEPQHKIIYRIAEYATKCPHGLELGPGNIDWDQQPVLLSECHCDLSGEKESHNSQHITYQDACMEYAKALTSKFAKMIGQGYREEAGSGVKLEWIFRNLVESVLLKHCCLGTELFSLCQSFFKLVKGYPPVFDFVQEYAKRYREGDLLGKGKANLLYWIESFPNKFAEEGKALKAQVLALPWLEYEESSNEDNEDNGDDEDHEDN